MGQPSTLCGQGLRAAVVRSATRTATKVPCLLSTQKHLPWSKPAGPSAAQSRLDSSSPGPAWPVGGTHPAKPLDAAGAPGLEHQLVRAAPGPVHSPQHHVEQRALRNDVREASHLRCPHRRTLQHSGVHLPVVVTWPADLPCEEKSGQPSAGGAGPPHSHPRLSVLWTWTGQAEVRQPCQEPGEGQEDLPRLLLARRT